VLILFTAPSRSRPHVPTTVQEDSEGEDEIPTISSGAARGDLRSQLAGVSGLAYLSADCIAYIRPTDANLKCSPTLSQNPLLASMVQGKLAGLIGKSSGYIDSLSPIVKQRVDGLKGLQLEHTKLEAEFQREILELEKRFAEKYRPIYERRRAIIEGKEEPTEEEIKTGYQVDLDDEDSEDEDEEAAPREREIVPAEEAAKGPKGIPGFWLTALSNHAGISELITERDEEALKHLIDVRVEYLGEGKPGFKLLFEFASGASSFFENKILEKTYFYQEEVGSLGDFVYERAEGTDIKWKTGKDLTVRVETKKQRNKSELYYYFSRDLVIFFLTVFLAILQPQTPTRQEQSRRSYQQIHSSTSSSHLPHLRMMPATMLTKISMRS
jgi:nucleosome assembly protein 1-like 1